MFNLNGSQYYAAAMNDLEHFSRLRLFDYYSMSTEEKNKVCSFVLNYAKEHLEVSWVKNCLESYWNWDVDKMLISLWNANLDENYAIDALQKWNLNYTFKSNDNLHGYFSLIGSGGNYPDIREEKTGATFEVKKVNRGWFNCKYLTSARPMTLEEFWKYRIHNADYLILVRREGFSRWAYLMSKEEFFENTTVSKDGKTFKIATKNEWKDLN